MIYGLQGPRAVLPVRSITDYRTAIYLPRPPVLALDDRNSPCGHHQKVSNADAGMLPSPLCSEAVDSAWFERQVYRRWYENASHSMHLNALPTGIRSLTQCLEETLIRVFFLHVFNLGKTFPKLVLYKSGRTAIRPRGASPFCGRHWLSPHCNCPWLVQEGMKTAPMN